MEVCESGSRCAVINGDELVNYGEEFLRCFLSELYILFISSYERQIGNDRSKKTKIAKGIGQTSPCNNNKKIDYACHVITCSCWQQMKTFRPRCILLVTTQPSFNNTKNILLSFSSRQFAFEEAKDCVSYSDEYNIFICTQINRSRRMRQVI